MPTANITQSPCLTLLADGAYGIRPIAFDDNAAVANLLRSVLEEYGCVGEGYAHGDPEVDCMFETYQAEGSRYWVLVETSTNRVVGGAGFSRLRGTESSESIAELQKLYFYPELRGKGLGKALLQFAIEQAQQAGYQTLYLETVDQMRDAIGLYERLGFQHRDGHLGNTGHQARMTVFMQKTLFSSLKL